MPMQSVAVSCSSRQLWKRVTFLKTPTVQQLWHLQSVGLASRLVQNILARVYCSQIQHLWEATEHSPWEQRLQQITYWHDSLYWQFWVSVAFSRVATLPDQMWHLKTFISPRVVPLFQLHVPCATLLGSYLPISQVHPSSRAPGRSSNLSPIGSVQSSQFTEFTEFPHLRGPGTGRHGSPLVDPTSQCTQSGSIHLPGITSFRMDSLPWVPQQC